jgi:hypothetical protein
MRQGPKPNVLVAAAVVMAVVAAAADAAAAAVDTAAVAAADAAAAAVVVMVVAAAADTNRYCLYAVFSHNKNSTSIDAAQGYLSVKYKSSSSFIR